MLWLILGWDNGVTFHGTLGSMPGCTLQQHDRPRKEQTMSTLAKIVLPALIAAGTSGLIFTAALI